MGASGIKFKKPPLISPYGLDIDSHKDDQILMQRRVGR
jgi:hypothetical protein